MSVIILSSLILIVIMLSILMLIVTVMIVVMLSVIVFSGVTLNFIIFSLFTLSGVIYIVILSVGALINCLLYFYFCLKNCHYVKRNHFEFSNADCRHTKCHYAECFDTNKAAFVLTHLVI